MVATQLISRPPIHQLRPGVGQIVGGVKDCKLQQELPVVLHMKGSPSI